jgi:hypothetical protein
MVNARVVVYMLLTVGEVEPVQVYGSAGLHYFRNDVLSNQGATEIKRCVMQYGIALQVCV